MCDVRLPLRVGAGAGGETIGGSVGAGPVPTGRSVVGVISTILGAVGAFVLGFMTWAPKETSVSKRGRPGVPAVFDAVL